MRVSSLWIISLFPLLLDAASPVCKICGNGVMTNPNGIPLPEAPGSNCAQLQAMGDAGEIIESMCTVLKDRAAGNCGCEEDTFIATEEVCLVCGIPGYEIVEDDMTSMCGSLKVAASRPNIPTTSCAELVHFTALLECDCQLMATNNEIASDIPSDIPSYFPSDAPSDVPSDFPSMAPTGVSGPHPVCNLCGDEVMGNPDGTPIPGADLTTCQMLQRQGTSGFIPESICVELALNAIEACACGSSTSLPEEMCKSLNESCTSDAECCGNDTACVGFCTITKKDSIATFYPTVPGDDRGGLRARH